MICECHIRFANNKCFPTIRDDWPPNPMRLDYAMPARDLPNLNGIPVLPL